MNTWVLVGALAGTAIGLLAWNVYDIGRERRWWSRAWRRWLDAWARTVPGYQDQEKDR